MSTYILIINVLNITHLFQINIIILYIIAWKLILNLKAILCKIKQFIKFKRNVTSNKS